MFSRCWRFVLVGLLAIYVAVGVGLYIAQNRLIFPQWVRQIDGSLLMPYSSSLKTPDGISLSGAILPAQTPKAPLMIAFGGNAHDVTGMAYFLWGEVFGKKITVAGFSYRGYPNANGHSGGVPTEQDLYRDAVFLYDEMVKKFKPSSVYTIGYSLGSAVATYLATQRPVMALTLVTPFTSMVDIAWARYPIYPVGSMVKYKFPVEEMLTKVKVPVNIVVAGQDGLIPPRQAALLREKLKTPGFYASVSATHGDILDHPDMPDILGKMVRQ